MFAWLLWKRDLSRPMIADNGCDLWPFVTIISNAQQPVWHVEPSYNTNVVFSALRARVPTTVSKIQDLKLRINPKCSLVNFELSGFRRLFERGFGRRAVDTAVILHLCGYGTKDCQSPLYRRHRGSAVFNGGIESDQ